MANATCSVPGCGKTVQARGWCPMHYQRWRKTGDVGGATSQLTSNRGACSIEECNLQARARGLCSTHYQRLIHHGSTDALSPKPREVKRCAVEGCVKPHYGRGYCQMHWWRWCNRGDAGTAEMERREVPDVCAVEGCNQPTRKFEWCASHYSQWYRRGEVGPFKFKWGDGGYGSTHDLIRRTYGKASERTCVDCARRADHWSYDYTDLDPLSEDGLLYSRDLTRYEPRCAQCHRRFDIAMSSSLDEVTPTFGRAGQPSWR